MINLVSRATLINFSETPKTLNSRLHIVVYDAPLPAYRLDTETFISSVLQTLI